MKNPATLLVILFFLIPLSAFAIVINEIAPANNSIQADADGDFSDWLELYNNGDQPLNLLGYFLSDDPARPQKWPFPDVTISPKSFLLIWCSEKNSQTEQHANFKLNQGGELITLTGPNNVVADSLVFPPLYADISYGRRPDGAADFAIFSQPTPAAANGGPVSVAAPVFSQPAGFYSSPITLEMVAATAGAEIRYTRDGSEPSITSAQYTAPISINSTTIIRAAAFKAGMNRSPVVTRSFYQSLPAELNRLPVLSLATDPDNLWDPQTGIYANPTQSGDDWERPVAVEFFVPSGLAGFAVDAGIRIHGGASRMPQKSEKHSFRLYFRSEYGLNRVDYPIIPSMANSLFERLVLRAGFNDAWIHWLDVEREYTTYVRDQLVRDLFMAMGHPASHGDYAHLFLNGEYWGLYNPSERYDDDFCDIHIQKGDWDVVKPGSDGDGNAIEASTGDLVAWNNFYNWYRGRSMSSAADYENLKSWVDINSFIDFYILNIFAQNYDWPRHNWYAARNRANGHWIFMPWDSEYAFGSGTEAYTHSLNMWDVIENQSGYALPMLYNKLKQNSAFRADVATRFYELFAGPLATASLLNLLDRRVEQIDSAIPYEAERWGAVRPPDVYSYDDWLAAVESMRKFIQNRPAILMAQLQSEGFAAPNQALPESWHQRDIGDVDANGFASYNDGLFTISGSGVDIWNTADEFYYVWITGSGDADVRARVVSMTNPDPWAKAGIMMRELAYDNAKNVYMALTPQLATFQHRAESNGPTTSAKAEGVTAPQWLRLVRQGDRFSGYVSPDGESWTPVGQATVAMRSSAMVGLAVTAHSDGDLCIATLDNVTINGVAVNVEVEKSLKPAEFVLRQNYPNPFNPETKIEFALPAAEFVTLTVYDAKGRLIQTLLRENKAAGLYAVTLDGAHLASGLYFYKIQAGPFVQTNKMLLVR